jgi:protein-disulfide isomerase
MMALQRQELCVPSTLVPIHEGDHVRGAASARITIVQYGDYDCPHTRASHAPLSAVLAELGEDGRFVFRHFPLRHMHANAEVLAELAEAAHLQGKFWALHDHLMAHRRGITARDVAADAAKLGIDMKALEDLVGTKAILRRVQDDVDNGKASGVHSTPTFFFNGQLHDGHYDENTLRDQLAKAWERLGA